MSTKVNTKMENKVKLLNFYLAKAPQHVQDINTSHIRII